MTRQLYRSAAPLPDANHATGAGQLQPSPAKHVSGGTAVIRLEHLVTATHNAG